MSSLLDESLRDAIKDPFQTVTIGIKPMSAQPATASGAADTANPSPQVQSQLNPSQKAGLQRNPQLAGPNPDKSDSIYEAQLAKLRHEFGGEYANILRDLGFMGENGQFSPGLIETEAARRQADLQTGMGNAERGVDEAAVRGGTFFSGRRAFNRAQATDPYTRDLSRLTTDTASALSQRLNDFLQLMGGYGIDANLLLAELSKRLAANATQNPSGQNPAEVLGSTNEGVIQGRRDAGIPNDANSYYQPTASRGPRYAV